MASSKEYLEFVLEQLAELDEITYRAMMGEYIIYYRGKIVGGIYDDRLLVKPIKSAIKLIFLAMWKSSTLRWFIHILRWRLCPLIPISSAAVCRPEIIC